MPGKVEKYEVTPNTDHKRGLHYQVVRVDDLGIRTVAHRYKFLHVANSVVKSLTEEIEHELP